MDSLPEPFRDLEPYLGWSLSTESERIARRVETPMDEILDFHAEMVKRLEEIVGYLNQYPYAEMPEDATRLRDMTLSLVEISNVVEMYPNPDLLYMVDPKRFPTYE